MALRTCRDAHLLADAMLIARSLHIKEKIKMNLDVNTDADVSR